jgi:large subunit ribosomal protein L17
LSQKPDVFWRSGRANHNKINEQGKVNKMRHGCAGRQFGRDSGHRKALLRMLVSSLVKNEKIETTTAKAKEIRPLVEKMITLAKRGDLHARRQALSFIHDESIVSSLFAEIAPRFSSRNGGYTRIVPTRNRPGDAAPMAVIELVDRQKKEAGEAKATDKKKTAVAAKVADKKEHKESRKDEKKKKA